ncbi:MAG: hypothetical protein WCI75_06665 [candidate division NC10 bacterium]
MSPIAWGKAGSRTPGWRWARCAPGVLAGLLVMGCGTPVEVQLRQEVAGLRENIKEKDNQLAAQTATIGELHKQLDVARSISEDDLKRIFYPERLIIDKLTGGADYDGKPGDDGVTVYIRPVDREGDGIKVAGDLRIQLYDLAAPPARNFIGEYFIPVDQVGKLWHGKLLTNHYTIKCPWPHGPPEHSEVTVRDTFVDYLTKRVLSAQAPCKVTLPPG